MKIYKYISLEQANEALEEFAQQGVSARIFKIESEKVMEDDVYVVHEVIYITTNEHDSYKNNTFRKKFGGSYKRY